MLAQLEDDFKKSLALYKEAELLALQPGASTPDSTVAAEAVFARAEIIFSVGDISTAGDIYDLLITGYPSSGFYPDALYRLGIIHLVNGALEKAIEKFKLCMENEPAGVKRTLASTGIMECQVELKNWPDALSSARDVLEENDEESAVTPRVLEVIAHAWRELGDEDNAEWYSDRLMRNYPDSFQSHAIREKGKRLAYELSMSSVSQSADTDLSHTEVNEDGLESETTAAEELSGENTPVFSVQASAFKNRMNAYKMYNNLKNAGFDVRVEMKTVLDSHWYKILIGRYGTREEAQKMIESVTIATGEKANVVKVE